MNDEFENDDTEQLPADNRFVARELNGQELIYWERMKTGNVEAMVMLLDSRLKPELRETVNVMQTGSREVLRMMLECKQGIALANKRVQGEVDMLARMMYEDIKGNGNLDKWFNLDSPLATSAPAEPFKQKCDQCGATVIATGNVFANRVCGHIYLERAGLKGYGLHGYCEGTMKIVLPETVAKPQRVNPGVQYVLRCSDCNRLIPYVESKLGAYCSAWLSQEKDAVCKGTLHIEERIID